MRKCTKCEKVKEKTEYYSRGKGKGLRQECKSCSKTRTKKWKELNPEKVSSQRRNENNLEYNRVYQRFWKFGLSHEEFQKMVEDCSGSCQVCGYKPSGGRRDVLCVDHCHSSGKVRGLLCSPCNLALGHVKDSQEILRNLINYLEEKG